MKGSNVAKGCALLLAFLAISVPLAAQESGLVLYAHGGGYSATQDVDAGGLADFDTGFSVGGGFGYAFSQRVALRADFTFGRSTANDGRPDGSGVVALDGQEFNRFFYGGDIQWRLPIGDRISPYIFGGGGAVTIDPNFSSGTGSGESFTKGAGKFGVGLEWDLNRSGLALLTQGTAWVYDMDNATFGFEETQFDLIYSLGLSYTIGF